MCGESMVDCISRYTQAVFATKPSTLLVSACKVTGNPLTWSYTTLVERLRMCSIRVLVVVSSRGSRGEGKFGQQITGSVCLICLRIGYWLICLIQVRLMSGYWRRMPERMTGRFWERVVKE